MLAENVACLKADLVKIIRNGMWDWRSVRDVYEGKERDRERERERESVCVCVCVCVRVWRKEG